jgi:hypothetical protein
MPELIAGELVAAAVVDRRVWEAQGDASPDGVYLTGQPGPAMPFVLFRAWKIPAGVVQEEVRLFGPSGKMVFRWGPEYREMQGMFDLTTEVDEVPTAVFDESGTYVASFVVDNQVLGEIEVPVYVQSEGEKLDKSVEEGLKKSDVIWIGAKVGANVRSVPCWFSYKNGKVYALSQREPGPQEQTIPGVGTAGEFVVITRRKARDTSRNELRASGRVLQGADWEEAAKVLVDRRRSRNGPPAEALARWRTTCDILELTLSAPID